MFLWTLIPAFYFSGQHFNSFIKQAVCTFLSLVVCFISLSDANTSIEPSAILYKKLRVFFRDRFFFIDHFLGSIFDSSPEGGLGSSYIHPLVETSTWQCKVNQVSIDSKSFFLSLNCAKRLCWWLVFDLNSPQQNSIIIFMVYLLSHRKLPHPKLG